MFEDYYTQSSLRELMIFSKMINFHVEYHENHPLMSSSVPKQYEKSVMDRLNMVFFYINQHYTEDITVEQLISASKLSKSTLQHTIQKDLNSTFVTLLNKQRVETVCQCLQRRTPIAEAAAFAGFPSANYMTRIFHRITGVTPSQYMAQHHTDQ